jgi:hypothetical protein
MEEASGRITEIRQEQTLFSYACYRMASTIIKVKKWSTDNRKNGIFMSAKMTIFEAKRWAAAHISLMFLGKLLGTTDL